MDDGGGGGGGERSEDLLDGDEDDSDLRLQPNGKRRGHGDDDDERYEITGEMVSVPQPGGPFSFRKLWAYMGPGFLVSIAYIDPGNFAVDMEAGSSFRYMLIWVLFLSTCLGLVLQSLCARLGVITGRNLAQKCRDVYPRRVVYALWLIAETTVIASDVPEVVGTAIALRLLCNLRMWLGVIVTSLSVLVFLGLSHFGVRKVELFIGLLLAVVWICFVGEFALSDVSFTGLALGFVPNMTSRGVYPAMAMVGAVVMPHNLFLHSALVQSRRIERSSHAAVQDACKYNFLESAIALSVSFMINVAIISVAAADFYPNDDIDLLDAPDLLNDTLGKGASTLFAIALLAAGQSSTMTGTLAGQYVMEGFIKIRVKPWLRAIVTRSTAILPSLIVTLLAGDSGSQSLIVLSQVILSIMLPFALIPLLKFTNDGSIMGHEYVNSRFTRLCCTVLGTALCLGNLIMAVSVCVPYFGTYNTASLTVLLILLIVTGVAYVAFIAYLVVAPVSGPDAGMFTLHGRAASSGRERYLSVHDESDQEAMLLRRVRRESEDSSEGGVFHDDSE